MLADPEGLAPALDNMMNSDIRDIGEMGYKKLVTSYQPKDMSERYMRIFESVLR